MKRAFTIIGMTTILAVFLFFFVNIMAAAYGAEPDDLTFLQGQKTHLLLELREARIEEEALVKKVKDLREQIAALDEKIQNEIEPSKTGNLNFSEGER